MTFNSGLQIALFCVLIGLSLLPRVRALRDRWRQTARAQTDRAPASRTGR